GAGVRGPVPDAVAVGHADYDPTRTQERLLAPESQRKAHAGERDERVVRRAIEERGRQAHDDDVSGGRRPHEASVGLRPSDSADTVGASREDVDDAASIGHGLHVEDGPGSRPVDRRGDCAVTPLVEHRVWITVTGLRVADAVTAVMPGEPANAGQADDTARSRIAAPDVHGHVPDIDEEIALDRATIDLDHVAELRDAEVHEVLHVLAV